MPGSPLHKAIKIIGSRKKIIRALGISAQRFNRWLNDGIVMGFEYALAFEHLTGGDVTAEELTPKKAQLLKRLGVKLINEANWINIEQMLIEDIHPPKSSVNDKYEIDKLVENIIQNGLLRPIGMDSNYQIIFGRRRFWACKRIGNMTVPVVTISLQELFDDPCPECDLRKRFTLSERAAIGIALEKYLRKQKGQNYESQESSQSNTKILKNTIVRKIGIHNKNAYEQLKKIISFGSYELIHLTDEEQISISDAALLARLPQEEQRKIILNNNLVLKVTKNKQKV